MNEVWKDIKGYEGLYQVSNLGRVKSLDRTVNQKGRKDRFFNGVILKPSKNGAGYYRVSLVGKGGKKEYQIHNIVAEHFLEKIEGCEVDHINFNKLDNHVKNLRYISHTENVRRSLFYRYEYDKNKGNNPNAKTILGYRNAELIETYECGKDLCLLIGMNYSTFKYKMQRGGIIFNNIHYIYGDYNRTKISKK